jgi:ubiquinone/menaquinone biosynthesis C-methylase UbiE
MRATRLIRAIRRPFGSPRRAARQLALGVAARILRRVRPGMATEERLLRWSWVSHSAARLDRYLVSGFQSPRINMQSILMRHDLSRRLFGAELEDLMDAEIRHAIELNEILRLAVGRATADPGLRSSRGRADRDAEVNTVIADREREFEGRWQTALTGRSARPLAVLELACGSANDYRAFADYGLAPFLNYTGVDLNPKNIANARRHFPAVQFEVGNAMDLDAADASVDVVLASDLFEHLPIEGIDAVIGEASRVAREALVLSFFRMAEIPDHEVRRVAAYHLNLLSRAQIQERLTQVFPVVRVIRIHDWLVSSYEYPNTFNRGAYLIVAERGDAPSSTPLV